MSKFEQGNTMGKGRRVGSKNRFDKEKVIDLINLTIDDLFTNYATLTTYQKIKILSVLKDVIRDNVTEPTEQAGSVIPEVIFLQPVHANEL